MPCWKICHEDLPDDLKTWAQSSSPTNTHTHAFCLTTALSTSLGYNVLSVLWRCDCDIWLFSNISSQVVYQDIPQPPGWSTRTYPQTPGLYKYILWEWICWDLGLWRSIGLAATQDKFLSTNPLHKPFLVKLDLPAFFFGPMALSTFGGILHRPPFHRRVNFDNLPKIFLCYLVLNLLKIIFHFKTFLWHVWF